MPKFIYKFKQLKERILYMKAEEERKINPIQKMHLGQMKLFMAELFFLARYTKLDKVILLYVGAASGYHTHFMARLFPQYMFHLYDRSPFHKIFYEQPLPNIKIYKEYFTHEHAFRYKKMNANILYMCDMRDLDIAVVRKDKKNDTKALVSDIDNIIMKDMEDQMEWAEIMNPIASYLKLRLPYDGTDYKYFDGTIYLQPFSPFSTEMRIYVTDHTKKKIYNCSEVDEKLAYFNHHTRQNTFVTKWSKIMKDNKLKDIWDSHFSLFISEYYLKESNKKHGKQDVVDFFKSVIDYHMEDNDKKYKTLYI